MKTIKIKLRIIAFMLCILLSFQSCKTYQSNTTAANQTAQTEKSVKHNKRFPIIIPIAIGVVIIGVVVMTTKNNMKPGFSFY
jgi:hypothetical protein